MKFYGILLAEICLTISAQKIDGEYYMTNDEQIEVTGAEFVILSNSSIANITQYIEKHQEDLINETLRLNLAFDSALLFKTYDDTLIYLCIQQENNIQCNYKIQNYLLDDQLQIENTNELKFSTNQPQCQQLINYKENKYIMIFKNEFSILAQLYNNQNQVLDQVSFYSNKKITYSFQQNLLLFYETETFSSSAQIYRFHEDDRFVENPINFTIEYDLRAGNIKFIDILGSQDIMITFEYVFIKYNFITQTFFFEKELKNFKTIGKNNNFVYGIDDTYLSERFNIDENMIRLGKQSEILLKVMKINSLLIFIYEKELIVFQNNLKISQIQVDFVNVFQISSLPFIIGISSNQIRFYHLRLIPNYIRKDNSNFAFVYYKGNQLCLELKSFPLNDTDLMPAKKIFSKPLILEDRGKIFVEKDSLIAGVPYLIYPSSNKKSQLQLINQFFPLKFHYQKGILILTALDQYLIAITEIDSVISSQMYDQEKKEFFPIMQENSIQTLQNTFLVNEHLVQIREQQIIHYVFDLSIHKFVIKNQVLLEDSVLEIKRSRAKILLLFHNCTIYSYNIPSQSLHFDLNYQVFFSSCKFIYSLMSIKLQYNNTSFSILYPEQHKKIYSFQNIIDCDQISLRLVIYELIGNSVTIKIYTFSDLEFTYLHTMPVYKFTIKYPLQKVKSQNFLAILAEADDESFILVYKVMNPVSSCLVEIILIDEGSSFGFLEQDDQSIYYVQNRVIFFRRINQLEAIITLSNNFNYVEKIQYDALLESQMCCYNTTQSFSLLVINRRLRINIENENKLYFKQSNSQGTGIIDLENVSGIINDIYLLDESENCFIQKPLREISSSNYVCQQLVGRICLTEGNKNIIDIFGQGVNILNPYSRQMKILFTVFIVSDGRYAILFLDHSDNLALGYSQLEESEKVSPIIKLQQNCTYSKLQKRVKNLFLFSLQINQDSQRYNYEILFIENNSSQRINFQFYIADIFYAEDYYIILTTNYEFKSIKIIYISDMQNIKEFNLSNIIEAFEQIPISNSFITQVSIIFTEIKNSILFTNFLIFSQFSQGYQIQLEVDLQNGGLKFLVSKIIRYLPNNHFLEVYFSSQSLLILKYTTPNNTKLHFYNLLQNKQAKVVDYFFEVTENFVQGLEQLNKTHYGLIFLYSYEIISQYNLTLVQINENYQLECDKNQQDFKILLKNYVEDQQAILIFEEKNELQISVTAFILFLNLILMMLFLWQKNGKSKTKKQIYNLPMNSKQVSQ